MNPNVPERHARRTPVRAPVPTLAAVALCGALLVPAVATPAAPGPEPRRLMREIGVMEKTIDEMLLDSTNLLVYSAQNNARGVYLDGYGVIFTFPVSLVERAGGDYEYHYKDFKIEDKGDQIIIRRSKEMPPDSTSAAMPPRDKAADAKALRARQAEQYAAGRKEMVEVLLDYGATMTLLRDDQRIALAAFLRDTDYFRDRHISRLTLSVGVADLRAFAAGRMTREDISRKVVEEEY